MIQINLAELTNNGQVRNLAGHDRGQSAREKFKLDELDEREELVTVVVPEDLYLLSPSFIQGMFSRSMKRFGGASGFFAHYGFDASPLVVKQVESGVEASLMSRQTLVRK